MFKLFNHQVQDIEFIKKMGSTADFSDPGTAKSLKYLIVVRDQKEKALVVAPKSILQAAWGEDIMKFTPELRYSVAYADNREIAFEEDVDIVITNHDAVKWLAKNLDYVKTFDRMIVDESTAFKNRGTQRTNAIITLAKIIPNVNILSGTPNPKSMLDLWQQIYLVDKGARLGKSFFAYRHAVADSRQCGPLAQHKQWFDKPGARDRVANLIQDITMRHKLEDCIDIPPNTLTELEFEMPPKLRDFYDEMQAHALLELDKGDVSAVHAAALAQKLLQIASGASYLDPTDDGKDYKVLDVSRYEMVLDLVEQREHSTVAIQWRHQRDALEVYARKRKISYAVIDGTVKDDQRLEAVERFQDGELQMLMLHPKSAGHGLTLTRGQTTIWASPTYNAEYFEQLNRRIYRATQTKKTETIIISAANTLEQNIVKTLTGRLDGMSSLLTMLKSMRKVA